MSSFPTLSKALIWLLAIAAILFAVNIYMDAGIAVLGSQMMFLTKILLVLTSAVIIAHTAIKSRVTLKFSILTSAIFLLLNLILSFEVAAMEYHSYQFSQISKINTCKKAERAFEKDIKKGSLRYYMFGMGIDEFSNEYLENVYGLKVYNMGCIVQSSLECYNELVEAHVSKKLQVEFWAFLDHRDGHEDSHE